MDNIKKSFQRVKQDMDFLKQEVDFLKNNLQETKKIMIEMCEIIQKIDKNKEIGQTYQILRRSLLFHISSRFVFLNDTNFIIGSQIKTSQINLIRMRVITHYYTQTSNGS